MVIGRRIIGKLLVLIATLAVASIGGFFLERLIPGNPVKSILGASATPKAIRDLSIKLGFTKPLYEQYLIWANNFIHGHLGTAYSNGQPVTALLSQNYTETIELVILSQILALFIAITFSIISAKNEGGFIDKVFSSTSYFFFSFPSFVVAPILVLLFAVKARILPATGFTPLSISITQNLKTMALPIITLTLSTFSPYYQILKADLVNTLKESFIDLARAKGLSSSKIMLKHALRPSTLGLVTTLGLQMSSLVTGAFVIEYIFGLPGLGTMTVSAIDSSDYLVVQAVVVIVVAVVAVINFVIDVIYEFIDPRIRMQGGTRGA